MVRGLLRATFPAMCDVRTRMCETNALAVLCAVCRVTTSIERAAPLFRHGTSDAAIRYSTELTAIRTGGQPVNTTHATRHHVRRQQQWQTTQPQTGCLCLAMPELPRLHDLAILFANNFHSVFVRDGILDAHSFCVGVEALAKELCTLRHQLRSTRRRKKPTHTAVA